MIKLKNILKEVSKPNRIDVVYVERTGRYYKVTVDGKKSELYNIEANFKVEIPIRYNETKLKNIEQQLKKQGIKFTYDNSMDVS